MLESPQKWKRIRLVTSWTRLGRVPWERYRTVTVQGNAGVDPMRGRACECCANAASAGPRSLAFPVAQKKPGAIAGPRSSMLQCSSGYLNEYVTEP